MWEWQWSGSRLRFAFFESYQSDGVGSHSLYSGSDVARSRLHRGRVDPWPVQDIYGGDGNNSSTIAAEPSGARF